MADNVQRIAEKLYKGDIDAVVELVQDALDAGMAPGEILSDALIAGMDAVGRDFKDGVLFVPEVMLCARGDVLGTGHEGWHESAAATTG